MDRRRKLRKKKRKSQIGLEPPFCFQHQCTMFAQRGLNPRKQGELPGDSQFSSRPSFYIKKQLLVMGVIWSCLYNFRDICALTVLRPPVPYLPFHPLSVPLGCFPGNHAGLLPGSSPWQPVLCICLHRQGTVSTKSVWVLLPSTELMVGSLNACNRKVLCILSGPSGPELSVSFRQCLPLWAPGTCAKHHSHRIAP